MITWALKLIPGGWLDLIIIAVFGAILGYAWVLHAERDAARTEADAAHSLAKAAQTINQSNKISIDSQNKKMGE